MRAAGPSPGSEPARRRCQGGYIGSHDGVPEAYSFVLPDDYAGEPDALYRSVEDDLLHGPWVHVTERGDGALPLPPPPPVRQAACHDLRACAGSSTGWSTRWLRRYSLRTPVKRSLPVAPNAWVAASACDSPLTVQRQHGTAQREPGHTEGRCSDGVAQVVLAERDAAQRYQGYERRSTGRSGKPDAPPPRPGQRNTSARPERARAVRAACEHQDRTAGQAAHRARGLALRRAGRGTERARAPVAALAPGRAASRLTQGPPAIGSRAIAILGPDTKASVERGPHRMPVYSNLLIGNMAAPKIPTAFRLPGN